MAESAMSLVQLRLGFIEETASIERLTTSNPPIVRQGASLKHGKHHDYYEVPDAEMEPADQIGENLSAAMVALIERVTLPHDPERCEECSKNPLLAEQRTDYGPRHPVRRALVLQEKECRRRHRDIPSRNEWRDHAQGPVCSIMLRQVVEHRWSILHCSNEFHVPYPRAERLVNEAGAFVDKWLFHWEHEPLTGYDPKCLVCGGRSPIKVAA